MTVGQILSEGTRGEYSAKRFVTRCSLFDLCSKASQGHRSGNEKLFEYMSDVGGSLLLFCDDSMPVLGIL